MKTPATPRIGLVLGGGGARGVAHIPVCEALDELGLVPAVIAGTSIGAIVGAGRASGMSGRDMRAHAMETFRHRGELIARLWRSPGGGLARILAPTFANPAQLNPERVISLFLPDDVPERFEELAIPFRAVATDFYGWQAVGLTSGQVRLAVAASIAIPMMFRPVVVQGRVMVDGGIADPLPTGFVGGECDIVVAVDVVSGPQGDPTRIPSPYESIFGSTQILMQAIVKEKLAQRPPDVLVRPNVSIFRVLDFMKTRAILRAAEPVKDEVKRALDRVLARG